MEISKDFKKWLDQYGRDNSQRKTVQERVYMVDSGDELFDGNHLSDVILIAQKLLTKYGDVFYDEHWTGYEDMDPSLVWDKKESDEEYELRISELHEEYLKEKEKLRKDKERAKLEAEMRTLQAKIAKLK